MEILIVGLILSLIILYIVLDTPHDTKERELLETVTSADRGTPAERSLVLSLLKSGIPAGAIFHDLYIKKPSGNFSQIDLVVATKAGIIVFEVKDYSGWIFGNGSHNQWTKVLAYGQEKYKFYNPIMQNNGHITALQRKLPREKVPFYSVIVFDGNCELKDISFVPRGTFIVRPWTVLEVVNNIINENEEGCYTDKHEVVRVLKEAVENGGNAETGSQHVENVEDMLGKHRIFE